MKIFNKLVNSTFLNIVSITFITFLVYLAIFFNSYIIDDKVTVLSWLETRSLSNIPSILLGANPLGHEGVYRPVRGLFYLIYYQLFGVNIFFYHLHAIIVHTMASIFVYLILNTILGSRKIAFLGGILFVIHPIHVEAIAYISSSMDILGLLFALIAFYLYIRSRSSLDRNKYLVGSYFFVGLGFFTNEITLVMPFIFIIYDYMIIKIRQLLKLEYLILFIPWIIYLFIRIFILHVFTRGVYAGGDFIMSLIMTFKAILLYVYYSFFPINLFHNHILPGGIEAILYRGQNLGLISKQSFFEPSVLLAICLVIACILLVSYCFKRKPVVSFSIIWFFITLLPVLPILPQGTIMHERFLYLPSFGFTLLICVFLTSIFRQRTERLIIFTFSVVALILVFFSVLRIINLKNEIVFWDTDIKMAPNKNAYAYYQLGNAYKNIGNSDLAIKNYLKAVQINPYFAVAMGSIGLIYQDEKDFDKAVKYFQEALKIDPNFTEVSQLLSKINLNSYTFSNGISFSYPKQFILTKKEEEVLLKDVSVDFNIQIKTDVLNSAQASQEYVNNQRSSFGKLENQGLAQIPSVDYAYVRVWRRDDGQLLQFFLFKNNKVVEIIVYPVIPEIMQLFDLVVASVRM